MKVIHITIIIRQIVPRKRQNMGNNDIVESVSAKVIWMFCFACLLIFHSRFQSHVIWLSIFNLIIMRYETIDSVLELKLLAAHNFLYKFEGIVKTNRHNYLAKEIIIQWHLTFRINILQIPAETFALETVS